jgi:hypothetical protein
MSWNQPLCYLLHTPAHWPQWSILHLLCGLHDIQYFDMLNQIQILGFLAQPIHMQTITGYTQICIISDSLLCPISNAFYMYPICFMSKTSWNKKNGYTFVHIHHNPPFSSSQYSNITLCSSISKISQCWIYATNRNAAVLTFLVSAHLVTWTKSLLKKSVLTARFTMTETTEPSSIQLIYSFITHSWSCALVTSSLSHPNILNTLSLCSSLNVRDQVAHSYRTTGKIIVLYILIFMFLDSRREDKSSGGNGSCYSLFGQEMKRWKFWTEW